ncbi:hypothetical protein GOQ04_06265 [Emticicia sp. ODNR4P]|nr:hypothetical protein [Emticicia sp. ODNR4P]
MFSLLHQTNQIKISDDSGFLAIVNSESYQSFVDEDWQLTQLAEHFVNEMNNKSLVIWSTGLPSIWVVSFVDRPIHKNPFREITSTIAVTEGKLYLTNFEDLSMSAQFEEVKIPAPHHTDLAITLENGLYNLTIRQLFDPQAYTFDPDGEVGFEIVVQKTLKETEKKEGIFWWTL